MPKTYTRLTEDERYHIYEGIIQGYSCRAIAKQLDRHHSSISRELIRNKGLKGYRPKQANQLAEQREINKPKPIKLTTDVQKLIRQHIKKDWSPEQVQGRLRNEGLPMVCPATIYGFIRQDKASGGTLYQHLRHRKPYKRRAVGKDTRGQIIGRISIDERPKIVEKKRRIGDWEADTVIGKSHKGVLVTLVDRVSKKTLIASVKRKRADVVRDAIIKLLDNQLVYTITFDNGKEFAHHSEIKTTLKADTYFAHPYHSWERGLNENHNGLIRQYLSKEMKLDTVSNATIMAIQNKLNNRPRKTLGYKTPNEVYEAMTLAS